MTKERYLEIINFAHSQRSQVKNNDDLVTIAQKLSMNFFQDKNEKEIFINNFIIPNTKEFLELRISCGKNIIKIAKTLDIPASIVFSKMSEISIFEKFIDEEDTKKELK